MDNTTEQNLSIAYEMIENDRLHDAVALLEPMLQKEPNNADIWWLYTHAVSEPDKARHALNNVLRLDPNYPGAAELSSSLEAKYPAVSTKPTPIKSLAQSSPPLTTPETLPNIDVEDDDVSDLFEDDTFDEDKAITPGMATGRRRRFFLPLVAALVIVVLVIALVIINPFKGTTPTPTPTSASQVAAATSTAGEIVLTAETQTGAPTEEATATQVVTSLTELVPTETEGPVEETATVESLSSPTLDFGSLTSALSGFDVPEDGVKVTQTTLGDTLVVTVCGDRSALAEVMDIVASESATLADDIAGVGVSIGDCDSPSSMRVIGVSLSDVVAYISGALSKQDFQKLWRPIA